MTPKQARDFIAKFPNAKSFVKPSHLEELSPLYEVHIEAIEVTKAEFHELEGGKTYMPRKETTDKFGQAAGVSFVPTADTTRKEGAGCYVGTAQAKVIGPDGKDQLGPICEYEFDVDVRLSELELNGKADWTGVPRGGRPNKTPYTEFDLKKERIQLMKVARQRANTGARSRATVAILGMQTGFKALFSKDDPDSAKTTFLFSRVIVNAKNELVMNRMLDSIAGSSAALFGPAPNAPQITAPAASSLGMPEGEPFRNANEGADADPFAAGSLEPATTAASPEFEAHLRAIVDWTMADNLPASAKEAAQAIVDRGESDVEVLKQASRLLKLQTCRLTKGARDIAEALMKNPHAKPSDFQAIIDRTEQLIKQTQQAVPA